MIESQRKLEVRKRKKEKENLEGKFKSKKIRKEHKEEFTEEQQFPQKNGSIGRKVQEEKKEFSLRGTANKGILKKKILQPKFRQATKIKTLFQHSFWIDSDETSPSNPIIQPNESNLQRENVQPIGRKNLSDFFVASKPGANNYNTSMES